MPGLRKERRGESRAKGTLWQAEYCATQMQDIQEERRLSVIELLSDTENMRDGST